MVRTKHYPSDATIADVLPNLEDAEVYLRQVLVTMRMCQKHYGDARVRIGVTGKATAPSYRIDRPEAVSHAGASQVGASQVGASQVGASQVGASEEAETGAADAQAVDAEAGLVLFGAYGGRSHDRFTQINTAETRWSTKSLGMAEMLKLHDSLRRPKDGSA